MALPLFSELNEVLGSVKVLVPFSFIQKQENGVCRNNIISCPLPGGINGKICVHHRDLDIGNILVIAVEGMPMDAGDVFIKGQFQWKTRNWTEASNDRYGGSVPEASLWLRGNGRLLQLRLAYTSEISGTVTVYTSKPKALPDYSALRELTALCDVVLRAAGKDFPAHKNVLAARSPVLATMFTGSFKESKDYVVDMSVDCSSHVFTLFMDFVYSGVLHKQSCEDLLHLLELGERYMVDDLKEACVRQLLKVGTNKEALVIFQAALEKPFFPLEVSRRAGDVIRSNWQPIASSAEWSEFAKAQPKVAFAVMLIESDSKLPSLVVA